MQAGRSKSSANSIHLRLNFWSFKTRPEHRPDDLSWAALRLLAQTDISRALNKDLRRRGFKFVGSATCYAFM